MQTKEISFTEAIREATIQAMQGDPSVHQLGLGVTYPNGADGTTGGLVDRFPGRVHDTPVSENAITGMAVGMAACGLRPIVHHGRIEFALYAADPILTQAANFRFMFGGEYTCPLTVRIALGRQWGNGPQHTRIGRGIFAAPGLKVVCPSTPVAAKGLLMSAIADNNPVLFMEHRWLYKLRQSVPVEPFMQPLDSAQILRYGTHVTIAAIGDMVVEALRAAELLADLGVQAEVIDLVSQYPLDVQTVLDSVRKTTNLVVCDVAPPGYSMTEQVAAAVAEFEGAFASVRTVNSVWSPCPTATPLTESYYPTDANIVATVGSMLGMKAGQIAAVIKGKHFPELHLAPSINVDSLIVTEPARA